MKAFLPIGFTLVLALASQAENPFAGLKRLDRVEVTDRDGDSVQGIVRSVVRGRLSLQIEGREGLTGSISFERSSVRGVAKTGSATEEELKAASEPQEVVRGFAEPERTGPAAKPVLPAPRPVLEAFAGDKWSAETRDEIAAKDAYLRSAAEREFLARFEEWRDALEREAGRARRRLKDVFPPEEGCTEEAYQRIIHIPAVLGRELNEGERDFVEHYEAWKHAEAAAAASRKTLPR